MKKIFSFLVFLFAAMSVQLLAQEEARLLRFPTVSGEQLVFSYAGDLYTTSINGGVARRLTSHNGYEMFPKFSPDGKEIAFTGQYDGNTEVFKIPANGGIPQRLTYTATLNRDDIGDRMGPNNIVVAWSPDGKEVMYRSRNKSFNDFKGQLYKVNASGGLSEEVPLSDGGFASFSPKGDKLAFNWVFREFRTWKYYQGGMADDIRIYDFKTEKIEKISDSQGQDVFPMWIGEEIYYVSDRDRIANLFAYNIETKQTRKVTNFDDFDIKFPSHSDKHIVFEKGGYIYLFDVATQQSKKIDIYINNDQPWARSKWIDASKTISEASLSPNGERVAFSARGDVWSVPAKNGITRNLTASSGVNERGASWSPNGKYIAYISDKTGEFEIYIEKQEGGDKAIQLTSDGHTYIFDLKWSPDSKKILYHNKKKELSYLDVETKEVTIVETSDRSPRFSYNWSPDSKWITYTRPQADMSVIRLYNLASKKSYEVTDNWYESSNPSFSSDGKYLFFTSARDFNPVYSQTEWNHAYIDMNRIYFITLAKETPSPFAPENDEVKIENSKEEDSVDIEDKVKEIKVDLDGIKERVLSLPISPGNYFNISAIDDKVYYNMINSLSEGSKMKMYDLKAKKETELGSNIRYTLSSNGNKMLVRKGKDWGVISLPTSDIKIEKSIDVSKMQVYVNLKAEWQQMYDEAWRHMRDFFYDPGMHGVNWKNVYDKYNQLVPHIAHRSDLAYITGEMIGELNVGHAYSQNGEKPEPKRVKTGLLGAEISRDKSGYFKIDKILNGANWSKQLESPLKSVGVDVSEGDYIISVDGISTTTTKDLYQLLVGKANMEVLLEVNDKPSSSDSRKVLINTISDESALYYHNWVRNNITKVNEQTNNRVGYLHIPDMGIDGLNEFAKYYYPQLRKEALIIDVRGNGGGNVSPMIIERLMRQLTYMTMHTGQKEGDPNPVGMHVGPKVTLLDKYSASDGDLFPYRFQINKLGKTVGTRSWGGVVGYSGFIPLIDGGSIVTPSYAPYDKEGKEFIIEGTGVIPDIIIENDAADQYKGIDAQLNKAVEVILNELKNNPVMLPAIPSFPVKSGK